MNWRPMSRGLVLREKRLCVMRNVNLMENRQLQKIYTFIDRKLSILIAILKWFITLAIERTI